MLEILNAIRDKILNIDEGFQILKEFVTEDKYPQVQSLLKLVAINSLSPEKAEKMILAFGSYNLDNNNPLNEEEEKSTQRKNRRAARPLEKDEFFQIIRLCQSGFKYQEGTSFKTFRPNKQLAMTLMLQANLGLRISDVLKLKPSTFKNDKLEVIEKKTGKLQYRDINSNLKNIIYEYAMDNGVKSNESIIKLSRHGIHKQLRIITDYLGLTNISSHSFRKFYGVVVYEQTGGDIELLKELFNHSDVSTTQRYIRVTQKRINEVSSSIDFTEAWEQ